MAYRKRTKKSRMRGSHTHGGGDKKKRRGKGHSGGKGKAGTGKRADSKKPSYWHLGRSFDKGFDKKNKSETKVVNVGDINLMIEKKKFEKKGSTYEINLTVLGIRKLLSKGKINHAANIIVNYATEKAAKKISALGGSINQNKG